MAEAEAEAGVEAPEADFFMEAEAEVEAVKTKLLEAEMEAEVVKVKPIKAEAEAVKAKSMEV